jgi:hypothetical protein
MTPASGHGLPHAEPVQDPDLCELLAQRTLTHWHQPLLNLCQALQGWAADFELVESLEPDFRPVGEVLLAVQSVPPHPRPTDEQLAQALCDRDLLCRHAVDRGTGTAWDPLTQPYRQFKRSWPDSQPYWGDLPPGMSDRLVAWMHAHTSAN